PVERRSSTEGTAFRHGLGQPALEKIPAIGEARLITLFRLDDPEPLLELGHRALALAGLGRVQHEGVGAQRARILWAFPGEAVHKPLGGGGHAAGPVLREVVASALTAPHESVEGREEIEATSTGRPLSSLP